MSVESDQTRTPIQSCQEGVFLSGSGSSIRSQHLRWLDVEPLNHRLLIDSTILRSYKKDAPLETFKRDRSTVKHSLHVNMEASMYSTGCRYPM